jgi:hypothetical protein
MTHETPRCLNSVDGSHQCDGFDRTQPGPRRLPRHRQSPMITFEYRPSGSSCMTRRTLFGGAALSGLALSSVGKALADVRFGAHSKLTSDIPQCRVVRP